MGRAERCEGPQMFSINFNLESRIDSVTAMRARVPRPIFGPNRPYTGVECSRRIAGARERLRQLEYAFSPFPSFVGGCSTLSEGINASFASNFRYVTVRRLLRVRQYYTTLLLVWCRGGLLFWMTDDNHKRPLSANIFPSVY